MDILNKRTNLNKQDKSLRSFIFLLLVMTAFLSLMLLSFITVKYSIIKHVSDIFKLTLVVAAVSAILFTIIVSVIIIYIYKIRHTRPWNLWIAKLGMDLLLPLIITLSEFLNFYKHEIKIFYIDFNNFIVKSSIGKYDAEEVLILLPHCLQNSNCKLRIDHHIENCHNCFKCAIGYIKEFAENNNIHNISVVTGGSAARNVVNNTKPRLIVAVACERDLASGITDIKKIPVIGILNKRPHGPCYNTELDLDEFKRTLENVLNC